MPRKTNSNINSAVLGDSKIVQAYAGLNTKTLFQKANQAQTDGGNKGKDSVFPANQQAGMIGV